MSNDTITLRLEGDVTLNDFADTMKHFHGLVSALSKTIAKGEKIEWIIEALEAGSASTTIAGISENLNAINGVIRGFETVGESLSRGTSIPYSQKIRQEAESIISILNGKITSVIFQTANIDYVVTAASKAGTVAQKTYSHGAIKGWIQTLSARGRLKFTLYDAILDKPVTCFLKNGQEDLVRNAWGKKVIVSGVVGRDETGRAISMREITAIKILSEVEAGSYTIAKGVIPFDPQRESPEQIIRRLRNDE